jgi:transcriptional regulator with XRE-family HTH domain
LLVSSLAQILVVARKRKLWSQAELAQRVDVSLSTITRAEQGKGTPNVNSLRRIAEELGFERDELIRLAKGRPASAAALAASMAGLTTADQLHQRPARASVPFPPTTRVPHYEAVSAVRADMRHESASEFEGQFELQWSQVPDMEIDFTVGVDGQCMEPRYEHGERIGCSIRRWQAEGFVWGKDYWIRFADDQTTLKRVRPDPRDPEKFVCTPLNLKTRPFSRLKADVVRAARVVLILAA